MKVYVNINRTFDFEFYFNLAEIKEIYNDKLYCNMKVIPQHKVIGPDIYDRITHVIKKL